MIQTSFDHSDNTFLVTVDKQKEIGSAISAIQTLGYEIKEIRLSKCYADFDNKYYSRFPENMINKLYKSICFIGGQVVTCKNGRLYAELDGTDIVLPMDLYSSGNLQNKKLRIIVQV